MRMTFGRLLAALTIAAVSGSAAAQQFTKGIVTSLEIVNASGVEGPLLLEVGYQFPDPQPPCREVHLSLDGRLMERKTVFDASGTFETTFPITCSWGYFPNGSEHTITATPVTGGAFCLPNETRVFGDPVSRAFTVNSPIIESAPITLNSTGGGIVTVSANFPFTNDAFSADERAIEIYIDGVLRAGGEFHPRHGTQDFPFELGCVAPGTHAVEIIARRCYLQDPNDPAMMDTLTTSFTTPVKQGTVTVNHEKNPNDGTIRLFGKYTLPPNTPSWELRIEELAAFDESGTFVPTRTLSPVLGPDGTFVIDPFAPATDALQVRIIATLSACNWQAEAMTAILCGECTKPPVATPNPVGFSDGNMRYVDNDPLPRQLDAVALTRTYDTNHRFRGFFARGWWSFFDARLIVHSASGGDTIAMTTETNETAGFLRRGGVYTQLWPAGQQVPDVLTFDGSYYVLRRAGSSVASLYRGFDGRFAGLRQIGTGREMRLEWSADGMPVSVTDSWTGLTWTITTDAAKRRITDIAIGDLAWRYEYDANDNLQRVVAPESATWRTYVYVDDLMTEARDASGNLIESHNYNAFGAATDSTGPDDEIESIQYLAGTQPNEKIARLTMKTGAIAEYVLQPIGNAYRTVRITGGCSSCGARDASYAYDADGHLVREQDASGYITAHTYAAGRQTAVEEHLRPQGCDPPSDPNRCRLDPASLATAALEATIATLRTDYEYGDPIWPDKPTAVTTVSVLVPGGSRVTTTVYHPLSGQVLRTNVSGWTGEAAKTDRGSSTIFYGDPPPNDDSDSALYDPYAPAFDPGGTFQSAWLALPQPSLLPKLMDGPRIDAEDITLFVYYPVSEAVPSEMRGRLAAVKNAAGHVTQYESYDLFGNVTRIVDPNGVATEMQYDILGRLETATIKGVAGCDTAKDPLCATDLISTRTYSPLAGPLESETRPGGGVTRYIYDARGRVRTLSRGPSATDLREQIEYTYDAATANKSLERTLSFEGGTWVEKTRESFSYDTLGQLITVTRAEVDGQTATAGYEYDPEGRMSKMRDENHTSPNTLYAYDPAGRVAAVTQTLATASGGAITTRYGYDVHGNITSVTDPNGNVTTYQYDDFGNLITQQSPVTGTTSYAYDDAGNLIHTADARGARTTRAYDALGRVITAETTLDGVTETVSWTYDDTTTGTFSIGRLAKMTDPAGTTEYRYERRGLLREEHRAFTTPPSPPPPTDDGRDAAGTLPCGPGDPEPLLGTSSGDGGRDPGPGPVPLHQATTKFTYDRDGNRASIAYPSTQLMVDYTFDFAGRPLTASGVITSAKYLPFGPLAELKFANSTTQTMQYDARYRMTRNDLTRDGVNGNQGEIARYLIGYDNAGNITSINDGKDPEYNRHFQYDDLHRLTMANTGAALWRKGDYQWDAMGNIVRAQLTEVIPGGPENLSAGNPKKFKPTDKPKSKKDLLRAGIQPLGRIMSFSYDETTPVITAVTLNDVCRPVDHDEAGNETAYAVTRSYWPRNLLASVSDSFNAEDPALLHAITYGYDGRGVRAIRTESPANGPNTSARRYYVYTPELQLLSATRNDAVNVWEPEADPNPSFANNVHYEIIWFGNRPVAQFNPGSFTRFTFTDHLGTPLLQTDTARDIVWRVEHEPFGSVYEVRAGTRTDQPLRFPGQEVAMTWEGPEESFNVHRWYKSSWGRYTSPDPWGLEEGSNLYAYVHGRPTVLIDPTGLCTKCDDCPSGEWNFSKAPGLGFSFMIGFGKSITWGTYVCKGNNLEVKVKIECKVAGIIVGAGAGLTGPAGLAPMTCACNSKELFGESGGWTGSLLIFNVDGGKCGANDSKQTYSVGVSKSWGAGFGGTWCKTKKVD